MALQDPDYGIFREVLRAVEGKMLQEVRQPPLPVFLIEGTRLHEKPVHSLPLRIAVGKDIISETVLEGAHTQRIPLRQRLLPRRQSDGREEQDDGKEAFQSSAFKIKKGAG